MKIAIGSENPVKVQATKKAFQDRLNEEFVFEQKKVASGVSDQPFDNEVQEGAIHRARRVRELFDADFGVGLEGGVTTHREKLYAYAWCAIVDRRGEEYCAHAFGIQLPDVLKDMLLNRGMELGDALDELLNVKNIKQKAGFFGLATGNKITREHGYYDMVCAALAPLTLTKLYEEKNDK